MASTSNSTARKRIRWVSEGAAIALLALGVALDSGAQSRAQSLPAPLPSPLPSATPAPSANLGGAFTVAAFHSGDVNAAGALDTPSARDIPDRSDLWNLLLNVSAGAGRLRGSASIGSYNFATVGQAINPTLQPGANTELYSALPLAQILYAFDSHLSVAAGKFAALLGQESPFSYQNFNVQRGLGWALEPTVSRGVHATYVNGPLSATLELNDAYYSGTGRAVEALVAYSPSPSTGVQFAAILPRSDLGPNPTVTVGNKAEYNLMYARQIGKLQVLPYLLWVYSPASAALGYTRGERATAAVAIVSYAFTAPFSLAVRYEDVRNGSASNDVSPNADLIGYGSGSRARTLTLTPSWHAAYGLVRFEYSRVWLTAFTAGSGFGALGKASTQERFGVEIGLIK